MKTGKALFLDRDGVINEDLGYTHKVADFNFRYGIFDLCRLVQDYGYFLIVITNQAGIGRGLYSEKDFLILTEWMIEQFKQQDIKITAVEFCPFHPEHGVGPYKSESYRRKPNPGMILDACRKYEIDPRQSIMIGDKVSDMVAAVNARVKDYFLLKKSNINKNSYPEGTKIFTYSDLSSVTEYLKQYLAGKKGIKIKGIKNS